MSNKAFEWSEENAQRLVSLVEQEGGVYKGLKKMAEELGQENIYTVRNFWYKTKLYNRLSERFTGDSRMTITKPKPVVRAKQTQDNVVHLADRNHVVNSDNAVSEINNIINYLKDYADTKQELKAVLTQNAELERNYKELLEKYNELLSIINKARVLYVNESVNVTGDKPVFKMEKNGNLEKKESRV